ncbi:MAG TPA: YafY family protein [Steroidobacteraceae bacterium]|nr:YafY family protein [Steroidobacteraceae bacterium]
MRRADRLFEIVHHLRGRRLTTAAQLAEWLEVSDRTVYRDIADLLASGIPIEGEAGVGYRLQPNFELPPLMFTHNEVDALVAGARLIESWGGASLAAGARSAIAKISAVLPPDKRRTLEATPVHAPNFFINERMSQYMDDLRRAVNESRYVELHYADIDAKESIRRVRSLGLFYWGDRWTLGAWCELRQDFRNFRLDRISRLDVSDERFKDETGKRLNDYLKAMSCE